MGQPVSLELTSRRWQRRALPVELCLPGTCHIPSCKRTSACSGRIAGAAEALSLPQKNWYPTRDSNPEHHVSETCAYPDFASGVNKKPGDLAVHPGSKGGRNSSLAVSFGPEGARGPITERARVRLLLSACPWLQSRVKHFNPRLCRWSYANAVIRAALTPKTKKPGALSRSGLVKMRQLSLAISPARTRAVLTGFPVIRHRALAALKQPRGPCCVRYVSFLHKFSLREGRALCPLK